jgi:hypothetical protein
MEKYSDSVETQSYRNSNFMESYSDFVEMQSQ